MARVGHTDTAGTLDGIIALSRARAGAVRNRLIEIHGAPPDRITAHGLGNLAPRGANASAAARARARRVEVVIVAVP